MTSQHKSAPLSYRPPKDSGDEEWLREHAKQTGRSINAIFADAVRRYRAVSPETRNDRPSSTEEAGDQR